MEENKPNLDQEMEMNIDNQPEANETNNNSNGLDKAEIEKVFKMTSEKGTTDTPWSRMIVYIEYLLKNRVEEYDNKNSEEREEMENRFNNNHNNNYTNSVNNDNISEESAEKDNGVENESSNSNSNNFNYLNNLSHHQDTERGPQSKQKLISDYPEVDELIENLKKIKKQPFTLQRICELLLNPHKYYKSKDKFLFSFKKLVEVDT